MKSSWVWERNGREMGEKIEKKNSSLYRRSSSRSSWRSSWRSSSRSLSRSSLRSSSWSLNLEPHENYHRSLVT